jgi:hypothetical protein
LFLLFYALIYGVWGLAALVFWERQAESRQVFIRCFFFGFLLLSGLFYLPLNPVAYLLAFLGRQEPAPLALAGWQLPARTVHFSFHLLRALDGRFAGRLEGWALMARQPAGSGKYCRVLGLEPALGVYPGGTVCYALAGALALALRLLPAHSPRVSRTGSCLLPWSFCRGAKFSG